MRWIDLRYGLVLGLLLPLAACASTAAPDVYATLIAEMDRCAAKLGYDRGRELTIGDDELAPGEQAWRNCVDDGIERLIIPKAAAPEDYRALVRADREMTQAIADGKMGRAERRARLDEMLTRIELQDRQRREAAMAKELRQLRDRQERQRLIEEMQRIQREASEAYRRLGAH